jgi:hypothetical protein
MEEFPTYQKAEDSIGFLDGIFNNKIIDYKPKTASIPIPQEPKRTEAWRQNNLLERIKWQESGSFIDDKERSIAVGDTGRAVGPYQIWPIYVEQANRNLPKGVKPFTLEDRLDSKKSEAIIDSFMGKAVEEFVAKYGKNPTETEIARMHHSGGIKGKHWGKPDDLEYGKSFDKKAKEIEDWKNTDYGLRQDGTKKGRGFFGPLEMRPNGKRNGQFATEISMGINIDGKEIEIPTLVNSLTAEERIYLLSGNDPRNNPTIKRKAIESAKKRMKAGLSPFKDTPPSPKKTSEQKIVGSSFKVSDNPKPKSFSDIADDFMSGYGK